MQWSLVAAFIPIVNILWCGASAQVCNYTSFLLNLGYSKECIDSSRSSLISCSNGDAPPYKACCPAQENITNTLMEVKTLLQEMKSDGEISESEIKAIRQDIKSEGVNSSSVVKSLLQKLMSDGENSSSVLESLLQEMKSEIKVIRHEMKFTEENYLSVIKSLLQEIKSEKKNSASLVKTLLQEMKSEIGNSVSEIKAIRQEMKSAEENSSSVLKSLLQKIMSDVENSRSVVKALLQDMKSDRKISESEIKAIDQEIKSEGENSSSVVKSFLQEMKPAEENSSSAVKSLLQEMKSDREILVSEVTAIRQEIKSEGENSSSVVKTTAAPEGKELPKNCAELKEQGETSSGVQTVYPYGSLNPKEITVFCDQVTDGGGWTVIQSRSPLPIRENFYRNWTEYVKGFDDLKGEFWLGLDNIHALTNSAQIELRIDLEDAEGERRWARYLTFHVGDAASEYVLNIGGYSGDAGDGMTYINNMKFTTQDNDNDLWPRGNCAEAFKGGWWFNWCSAARLNGLPIVGMAPMGEGIIWATFRVWDYSMKKATMRLRPVSLGF